MAPSCCASLWRRAEYVSRLVLPIPLLILMLADRKYADGVALDAVSFLLPAPPALSGNLATNNALLDAEQIQTGQIGVPHSFAAYGDNMYAVTDRGQVVNVAPCRPVVVANLRTRGCQTAKDCGHLVSIRLSPDNLLLVLDAYRGLFEVHPYSGVVRLLYDAGTLVNGRPSLYLNDFALLHDGTLVFSDASPTFDYDNEFWIRFEGRPDGRLLTYNTTSGQAKEVLAGISYPTGLEVTDDGRALLASEAGRARILRISLTKDKFMQRSFFSENLPGMPEHIRKSGRGTYWVGLSYPRFHGEVSITDQYSNKPSSRNFLAVRRSKEQLQLMYTKRGLAIEVDKSGKIVRSFHDPTGLKIGEVLELVEYSAVLYVGTRAAKSTVRIVGSPNALTVDSLVQVLRGRCKVTEDKIQEAKVSLEQQLKAQQNTANDQGFSSVQNMEPGEYSGPSQRRINIGQGLSELRRTLVGAPQRQAQNPSLGFESVQHLAPPYKQDSHNFAPPFHQQGSNVAPPYQQGPNMAPPYQHNIPPAYQRPGQSFQRHGNSPMYNGNVGLDDPFLPANGPHAGVPLQRANKLPLDQNTQLNEGSSNQPRVVHSLIKGELVSHVVLGKKAEAALAGNLLTDGSQVSPSHNENPTSSAPVSVQNVSPPPQRQAEVVQPQKAPEELNALGGFLGFIDSNARAGATFGSENQQPKQSHHAPLSTPDQNAPGHLEPLHGIISYSAHQADPHSTGGLSFPGLELFTGSQDLTKQNPANRLQSTGFRSSLRQSSSSLTSDAQKHPAPDVVEMPNVIQNIQMFHPTDRPEQSAPSQNQAGPKLGSSFQQKAALLKQGLQQLHKIFQESPPVGQLLTQRVPERKESRSTAQGAVPFTQGDTGKQSVQRENNGDVGAAIQVNNKQTRISNSDVIVPKNSLITPRHNDGIYENNANLAKQPLTPFSGASTIHHNQPNINLLDRRFSTNTQTRIDQTQGGVNTNTNSPTQTNHGHFPENINSGIHKNDNQSSTNINSGTQTSHLYPSLLSGTGSYDTRQNVKQEALEPHQHSSSAASSSAAKDHAQSLRPISPTGYIQVYQGPGQYLLIPLTETSLIQALRGLSPTQMKSAQIVTPNPRPSEQSAAVNENLESTSKPIEVAAVNVKQGDNLTQVHSQRQQMPNQPASESLPGKRQIESQNGHVLEQDSRIQNLHQQNQQQLHQGQWFERNEQTQPRPSEQPMERSQRQHLELNAEKPPVSNANIRQEQDGRFAQSNNKQTLVSTLSANTVVTSTPQWSTHNSDQENGQSTQQITRIAQQGTHLTQRFSQPTQQFPQSTGQFSQPAQQFNEQTTKFEQSNQHLSQQFIQPTHQFTQPTQQFTQPARQFTQPARQFTQQINRMPTQYATSNTPQQSTQHFNTHTAPTFVQQPIQEYNKLPTHQLSQHTSNYSVSLITKFPTQHRIQHVSQSNTQLNQQNSQQTERQQTAHNIQDIAQPTSMPTMNTTYMEEQIEQATVWEAPHFIQPRRDSIQAFNHQNQQPNAQPIQQRQQMRQSFQESDQMFTQKVGQDSTQYSTQGVQVFDLQPVKHGDDNSRPYLASNSQTQQSQMHFSQSTRQYTEQPTRGFNQINVQTTQQLNSNMTPNFSPHFSGHLIRQSSEQQLEQPSQLNSDFSRQVSQQPVRQSSQQSTSYLQTNISEQPVQQNSQQFNNYSTSQPIQQPVQTSLQQFNSYSTSQNLPQPVQTSPQQSNSYSTSQNLQQPVQTSQQFNSYSTSHNLEQPTQTSSKPSQFPRQFTDESTRYVTHQFQIKSSTQTFIPPLVQPSAQSSTQHQPHTPSLQPPQHLVKNQFQQLQFTPQQLVDYSTQFTQRPTHQSSPQQAMRQTQNFNTEASQHFTYQPTQLSPQRSSQHSALGTEDRSTNFTQQTSQQTIQPTQNYNTDTSQHFTNQPTQLSPQPPSQHSALGTEDRSTNFTQQTSQQTIQPTQNYNTDTSQHFTNQPTQLSPQPPSQHSALGTEDRSTNFTQQTSQQTIQPTQNYNTDTSQHFTNQPTQLSPQPPSQHSALGTEDRSTNFTQQTSQQTIQPTQNYNTDTSQHFTNQPTQLSPQRSSQHPAPGTEDRATQFTQHTLQQTSQQTMQPTQNYNTDTSQHFTNQPTKLSPQQSSQQLAMRTEDRPTKVMQQTSQQTMQPTQNYDTHTSQHFTNQPTRLSLQPSSQNPAPGTEDRSTHFTQQTSQQTSQQTNLQQTQESRQTTMAKQSADTNTAQYLTRTPQPVSGRTKQAAEEIVEQPNGLFLQ